MPTAQADEALASAAHSVLTQLGEGDTKVVDASLSRVVNAVDQDAWLITLVLPRPRGSSWEVDKTIALRQEARRRVDDLVAEKNQELDGVTSVVLTTNEAPIEEIGVDEQEPSDDEQVGAFFRESEDQ